MSTAPPTPQRLQALIARTEAGLLERDVAVRIALLAALAGEHVLLIGPPGTAKSELARRLHRDFEGARYFERLLTRFSTPEELFGPLSLKALEDDRYERLTDGYLPTAGIAFLDEVFKANSAILNALLTLLEEREFDNGSGRLRTPLVSVVGASNELPGDESLLAFFDRFLLRVPVRPVGDASFGALLALPAQREAASDAPPITAAEREALLQQAAALPLTPAVRDALFALRQWCAAQQLAVSDRRWRRFAALLRIVAACEGRSALDALDLWLAPFVVAAEPEGVAAALDWFVDEVAAAAPQPAEWLTRAVQAFERQLELEAGARADEVRAGDADDAGKMAVARSLGGGAEAPAMPRLLAGALEERQRRRYSPLHLHARLAQLDELIGSTQAQRGAVAQRLAALREALAPRLWMPPSIAQRLLEGPTLTLATLEALLERLATARAGFAALPVDQALAAAEPAPVRLEA